MSGPTSLVAGMPDPANSSDTRTGTVTAVTARGISVAISGGAIDAAHLDSYAPAVGDTVALTKTQDSWLCLGRIVGSGTAKDFRTPGTGVGPSILAAMRTFNSATLASSTGGTVVVPSYTLTYYHPPGHSVLILMAFNWTSTASADFLLMDLTESISNTPIGELVQPITTFAFGRMETISALVPDTLSGAKRTIVTTMARLSGTGTTSINAIVNRVGYMIALDLGDKSVIVSQ